VRPLRKLHGDQFGTAPLTVTVDPVRYAAMRTLTNRTGVEPDLAYLYRHQLAETDIVAVNKTDLLTPAAVQSLTVDLAAAFPHAEVIAYSAATGSGLSDLVARWETASPAGHTPIAEWSPYAAWSTTAQIGGQLRRGVRVARCGTVTSAASWAGSGG
jgi:hypothetical protein